MAADFLLPPFAGAMANAARGDSGRTEFTPAFLDLIVQWTTVAFEVLGVAVIVVGTICAAYTALARVSGESSIDTYNRLRANVGRAILLGLELLVAADIISTVAVNPTIDSVVVLGLIVIIRTFLSFSLEVEINGRWPWQQHRTGGPS